MLTDVSGSNDAVARNRRLAFALLGGFLLLAFAGALVVSRQLQGQIGRFLAAAKRVGGGDFSTAVPTEGNDEFAQLGDEFNKMSQELERRIGELDRERGRLRESIQRVGETFASNLDRRALLELGAETIAEAVEASAGRATAVGSDPVRIGEVDALAPALDAAEARARATGAPAQAAQADAHALACPIPRSREGAEPHGVIAVARRGRPFDEEELTLVGSLAVQTGISLENVELHDQVARQAVTDELTGLFNHRRFQEVMTAEVATAQRFGQPLGLLLLDIDNFKKVNDTYGHQQGDLVLKAVAAVLRENSREIDEPARYGGEEMAVAPAADRPRGRVHDRRAGAGVGRGAGRARPRRRRAAAGDGLDRGRRVGLGRQGRARRRRRRRPLRRQAQRQEPHRAGAGRRPRAGRGRGGARRHRATSDRRAG